AKTRHDISLFDALPSPKDCQPRRCSLGSGGRMMSRTAQEWQQWLTDFSRGQNPEAWRGIMCFLRWMQIRADNGHPIPNFLPAMEGDIYHSHLLRRMLDGKEP